MSTVTSNWVDSQHPATLMTVDSNPVNGYWPAGQLRKAAYGNNLTTTSAYNNRLQPCRINVNSAGALYSSCTDALPSGNVQDFTYAYNLGTSNNGSIMSLSATGTSGAQNLSKSYTYDNLNRLATMSGSGGNCTGLNWSYDTWGNRTAQTPTGGTCNSSSLGFDTNNRINSPSGYAYDANGNLINDTVHHYYYDAENRIIQVDGTLGACLAATACYVYDAEGKRMQKLAGSTQTNYIYDLSGHVVAEDYGSGWGPGYVYAGGQLIGEYKNSTTYFVHDNNIGTSTILTSVAGAVADCNALYPFGEQDNTICTTSATTTHKFTGKERDTESNLDNFGARYYSSAMGRFLTADWSAIASPVPYADLHDPQTLNLYAYVGNNPLGRVDPDGHLLQSANDVQVGNVQSADLSSTLPPQQQQAQRTPQSLAAQVPPAAKAAIADALRASNSPRGDDKKGGYHEESVKWGKDASGNVVVSPSVSGNYAPPGTNPQTNFTPANPKTDEKLVSVDGFAHIHPKGGGDRAFVQSPSGAGGDQDFARGSSAMHIVVGAADKKVYFFNSSGVIGKPMKLSDFMRAH